MSAADSGSTPTGPQTAEVATLVEKQSAEHYKRLRRLKGEVRRRIEEGALETVAARSNFIAWFRSRLRTLLALAAGTAVASHYTTKFIDSAFSSGWRAGAIALSADGRSVDVPRSMNAVEEQISGSTPGPRRRRDDLRGNQREQLDEVATDLTDDVLREIRDSIRIDVTREESATAINGRIDVATTRTRRTADYELSNAYNVASAERMRTRGVFSVRVVNPSPCREICAPRIADNPYPIRAAVRGELCPFHPHCRGTLEPA